MPTVPSESTALLADAGVANLQRVMSRDIHKPSDDYGTLAEDGPGGEVNDDGTTTWRKEAIILARYGGPLILTYSLEYAYTLMIVYMSGRLGSLELAAASIATMTANITGMVVYEALASCLDTLTSQAYGSGNKMMVGLHVQRMMALVILATIPIGAVWLSSGWILERLIPELEIAQLAGKFLKIYIIGAPGYGLFEAAKRLTQASGNFHAALIVLVFCAPLNILWNWLFVIHLDLGFEGVALAAAISFDLQPIFLFLYIYFFAPSTFNCWPGVIWSKIFYNWGPMIKLAIPSLVMIISEWLAFEVLTFATSHLGPKPLAAQSVLMTIGVAMYHIPFPVSIAASTRFGNLIGNGNVTAARTAFKVHYIIFLGIGLMDIALLVSLRTVIPGIFTDDAEVKAIITTVLPLMATLQFVDATTAISNGLLRGLGKQAVGGWINASAYYVIGIPLAMFMAFGPPHAGLIGMWVGPTLGLLVATVVMFIYMRCTNWNKAVEEARAREE